MSKRFKSVLITFLFTGFLLLTLGLLALILKHPLIFPSLGPTAFLLATNPAAKITSAKNTILGHLVGALCGYFALVVFGLTNTPAIIVSGISIQFVLAATLSISLTSALMKLFSVEHPPAGATTLIISLGILHTLPNITVLMIAVILLYLEARFINNMRIIKNHR